jgi:DNA-binding NtrC family response regulator
MQRLLIADDEETILFAMRDYFEALGWEVDCAQKVPEARALLEAHEYAVVIADLRLTPDESVSGLDLLDAAKHRRPATRTIILTAYGSQSAEDEARRLGIDAWLHKSEGLKDVAAVVSDLAGAPGGAA